ncbi:MAG: double zinc ribbon domain-containing protein [Candidatus Helarchaeota archaeon]
MTYSTALKCKFCNNSEALNILKVRQPGYGNKLHVVFKCPACNKKTKQILNSFDYDIAEMKAGLNRCFVCNSPNVQLYEDPLRLYGKYKGVSTIHVKLKYLCNDCKRRRLKVVPIDVMRTIIGGETKTLEKKPETITRCPFCDAKLEISSGQAPNICDNCGSFLKCPKCNSMVVIKDSQFCMTCGTRLEKPTSEIPSEIVEEFPKICPQCESPIREGINFCTECGQRITCECGNPVDPAFRFCTQCGKPLENE